VIWLRRAQAERWLKGVLRRMARSEICNPASLVGCSEAEIKTLEHRYQLHLPFASSISPDHGSSLWSLVHVRPHGDVLKLSFA
jgi:hypothetical protein